MNTRHSEFDLPTRPSSAIREGTLELDNSSLRGHSDITPQANPVSRREKKGKKSFFIILLSGVFILIAAGPFVYKMGFDRIADKLVAVSSADKTGNPPAATQQAPAVAPQENSAQPDSVNGQVAAAVEPVVEEAVAFDEAVVEEVVVIEKSSVEPVEGRPEAAVENEVEVNPLSGNLLSSSDEFRLEVLPTIEMDELKYPVAHKLYLQGYQFEFTNKVKAVDYWELALEHAPDDSEIYRKIDAKIENSLSELRLATEGF